MTRSPPTHYATFAGERRIASGDLHEVVAAAKAVLDANANSTVLIFDNSDGRVVDVDFRGALADVLDRLPAAHVVADEAPEPAARKAGRPRLGVVGREVTLLPRHWDWLATQPGGASVALRRLVEEARKTNILKDLDRKAGEVTYRFMATMAGDRPGFEEATRALFAGDRDRFRELTQAWPADIRDHARELALGGGGGERSENVA